jgi:signal transduction histidine kinase
MAGIGWWITQQIEHGVITRAAYTTALYVDSFVAPPLQELATGESLSPAATDEIARLLKGTTLGNEVVAFKVWGRDSKVIYSGDRSLIGRVFPATDELAESWAGHVTADLSDLSAAENVNERAQASMLLEIYSPVRANGSGKVIAVAEYYLGVDELNQVISQANQRSWMIVIAVTLGMYLLLSGFVHSSSATIVRQEGELRARVARLTELVSQNDELHDRVRRAAARSAAFNERFLRRVSAELHDGPAQYLGLALLRIDQVAAVCEQQAPNAITDLNVIQGALGHAMQEVRGISAGLGLPHIETLSLSDTVARVVRAHERTTNTKVEMTIPETLPQICLATKIATYRLIQEALSNATRHAGGVGQRVTLEGDGDWLIVSVSDKGPGFSMPRKAEWGQHMGLAGMRERVESLGGDFAITCRPGLGTHVTACLPCQATEEIL